MMPFQAEKSQKITRLHLVLSLPWHFPPVEMTFIFYHHIDTGVIFYSLNRDMDDVMKTTKKPWLFHKNSAVPRVSKRTRYFSS